MTDFLDRFDEFVGASGWRTLPSPSGLVEQWREFVGICAEGYSSTIYEYENERAVRDLLEKALHDPILRKYPEMKALRELVEEIDHRFHEECRDDAAMANGEAPWWQRCVPKRAEGEFADDLRSKFGIDFTV